MFVENKEIYAFGQFRLDIAERLLVYSEDDKQVRLTEKAFETLCVLVRNSGHLLSKEELLNQVWGDSFVEENNLDKCIYAIRQALGEKPGEQKFIETVRKHGYRFVADVQRVEKNKGLNYKADAIQSDAIETLSKFPRLVKKDETQNLGSVISLAAWRQEDNETKLEESLLEESTEQNATLEVVPPIQSSKRKTKSKYQTLLVTFALITLLAGAIGLTYYLMNRNKTASITGGKKSIAVLPLKPINTANREPIYEFGIAESLILKLNSTKSFIVRPLSATRKYVDVEQDPIAAGREQKVDYVLASNYQLADGKIKVTAHLFNIATGQIEETYKSEKDAGDVFSMQDAIAGEIGNKFFAGFATTSGDIAAKRGTANEEAYRLYLQGRYLVDGRNAADARKAVEVLDKAVKLDPNYAQAWAGKAHAHLANHFGRDTDLAEQYQKTLEAINKALALDANSADAQSALCETKLTYEWDFNGAETACRRAVELNPDSALAHQIYSRYLNSRGRFDEAINEIKMAIDLEPASLFNQRLFGNCLQYAHRYDEAVAQFKRVIEMKEDFGNANQWLSMTLAFQGKEAEAFEVWTKFLERQKADQETVRAFQTAFQTSGWQGVMSVRAERFEKGNEIYFHGAAYNAMIGNKDKAFEYLEKSFQRREWGIAYLEVDPRLDNIRDDPRFVNLVRRVEKK